MAHSRRTLLVSTAAAMTLAGCLGDDDDGGDNGDSPTETPTDTPMATPTTTPDSDATVSVATHPDLGDILVDGEGMVLYMFDADEQGAGESTCYDDCEANWPPLTVEDDPVAGSAVEAELTTFERDDGTTQVAADGWPLYYWVGDSEPGDATGQGVEDIWWVLRPDATPVRPADVSVASHPDLGDVLVDGDGMALYMFDADEQGAGESTCYDDCESNWPPLTVDGDPRGGPDVTADLTTFEREDGSVQVAANGWPLYYFAGDSSSRVFGGQGVQDVWWLLDPAGMPQQETSATPTETDTPGGGGGPGY